jgi:hypothetical protein
MASISRLLRRTKKSSEVTERRQSSNDRVVLTVALPDHGLEPGDVGVVVHVYPRQEAYEVEFVTLAGQTAAIVTASADQIRPIGKREIPHARELAHR